MITDILDDQERGEIALEVDGFLELGREANAAVTREADLLPKLAQDSFLGALSRVEAAARSAPPRRVTKLYEHELTVWGQRQRMGAEGARAANEPAGAQQPMRRRENEPEEPVPSAAQGRSTPPSEAPTLSSDSGGTATG